MKEVKNLLSGDGNEDPFISRRQALTGFAAASTGLISGCSTISTENQEPGKSEGQEDTPPPNTGNNSTQNSGEDTPEETPEPLPKNHRIHLKPGKNKQLRKNIPEKQLEKYINDFGTDLVTNSNIFSETQDNRKTQEIDLLALEYWHDNDPQNIRPQEAQDFLKTIGKTNKKDSTAWKAKNQPFTPYPNFNRETEDPGHFNYQEFTQSQTLDKAQDWIQIYLFNWQRYYEGSGPISTEDELYAAVLEEAIETHTDIDTHFFGFDLPARSRSGHGNGMAYDKTNNKLYITETITGPKTQTIEDGKLHLQYHPLIENSNYLEEDHEAEKKFWHPLKFHRDPQQDILDDYHHSLDFEERKGYVGSMLMGIATGQDDDIEVGSLTDVAITNEYANDLTQTLETWNNNPEHDQQLFQEIIHQAKTYNKLAAKKDQNYIISGTIDDPKYTKVEDRNIVRQVWNDINGKHNNIKQTIQNN